MPAYWERLKTIFWALNEQTFELVFAVNTLRLENFRSIYRERSNRQQKDCFNDKWASSMQITANQVTSIFIE